MGGVCLCGHRDPGHARGPGRPAPERRRKRERQCEPDHPRAGAVLLRQPRGFGFWIAIGDRLAGPQPLGGRVHHRQPERDRHRQQLRHALPVTDGKPERLR